MNEDGRFLKKIKEFVARCNWAWAKTYANTWPHYYIVKDRVDEGLFMDLVRHIRRFGKEGPFYNQTYIYYEEDGWVYWTMGDPIEKTTIINRCEKENTYEYRLKAGMLPK